MSDCQKCDGNQYFIEDGEKYWCPCVKANRYHNKMDQSGIGAIGMETPVSLLEVFEDHEDFPCAYLHCKLPSRYSIKKLNSILSPLIVRHAWEKNVQYFTIDELRDFLKRHDYEMQLDHELIIVSYGLRGDYDDPTNDDMSWLLDSYEQVLKQVMRWQITSNNYFWLFSYDMHLPEVERMINNNKFTEIDLDNA